MESTVENDDVVYSDVLHKLKELSENISVKLPNVPGKNKLIRACTKEIDVLNSLPPSSRQHAAACSNLPHLRAVAHMAEAYGDRLLGLLRKYRSPKSNECVHESCDTVVFPFPEKQNPSVIVDLVCLQTHDMDVEVPSSSSSANKECPGNASDATEWLPHLWIKVVTRSARRINAAWHGEATQNGNCLCDQLEELQSTISWRQRDQVPSWVQLIVHWLPLTQDRPIDLDPQLMKRITDHLRIPFLFSNKPWLQSFEPLSLPQPHHVRSRLSVKRHMIPVGCIQHALSDFPSSADHSERDFRFDLISKLKKSVTDAMSDNITHTGPYSVHFPNSKISVLDALLQQCHLAPFSQSVINRLDLLPRINLDVSAMIALVSDLSQFIPDCIDPEPTLDDIFQALKNPMRRTALLRMPRFKSKAVDWMIESEAEKPVVLVLRKILRDSVLLVCRTALFTFVDILATIAGPGEWSRGVNLLTRVVVIPDIVDEQTTTSSFGPDFNNRQKSQLILDVGSAFQALTVTSNGHLLRCQRNNGHQPMALLIPARVLTEEAPKK